MDNIRKILDDKLHNNDTNLIEHILGYAYPRCGECDLLFNSFERLKFDDRPICERCFIDIEWNTCSRCGRYYDRYKNIWCKSCSSACKVYCPICLGDENKLPSKIIDEIIETVDIIQ